MAVPADEVSAVDGQAGTVERSVECAVVAEGRSVLALVFPGTQIGKPVAAVSAEAGVAWSGAGGCPAGECSGRDLWSLGEFDSGQPGLIVSDGRCGRRGRVRRCGVDEALVFPGSDSGEPVAPVSTEAAVARSGACRGPGSDGLDGDVPTRGKIGAGEPGLADRQ